MTRSCAPARAAGQKLRPRRRGAWRCASRCSLLAPPRPPSPACPPVPSGGIMGIAERGCEQVIQAGHLALLGYDPAPARLLHPPDRSRRKLLLPRSCRPAGSTFFFFRATCWVNLFAEKKENPNLGLRSLIWNRFFPCFSLDLPALMRGLASFSGIRRPAPKVETTDILSTCVRLCFFRWAMAVELTTDTQHVDQPLSFCALGVPDKHAALREQCVDYMLANRDDFEPSALRAFCYSRSRRRKMENFVKQMNRGKSNKRCRKCGKKATFWQFW